MRGAQRAADADEPAACVLAPAAARTQSQSIINKFLTGAADFIQRSLGENIQIKTVDEPALWLVEADPNQLESALVNLAINARDAMPDGGKVKIVSRQRLRR